MAAVRLFSGVDDWFAERGFVRHGSRSPVWVKDLPHGLQMMFVADANKRSKDVYESAFNYYARFPALKGLERKLFADSPIHGMPTGLFTAIGLKAMSHSDLYPYGYNPFEASGSGPLWDEFLALLDPALVKLEEEITRQRDFRRDVAESDVWDFRPYNFADIFVDFHVGDFEHARYLLETTDWYKRLNPQNFSDEPGELPIGEFVDRAVRMLGEYIDTHDRRS